jgi:PAS domain S-box-containing protein
VSIYSDWTKGGAETSVIEARNPLIQLRADRRAMRVEARRTRPPSVAPIKHPKAPEVSKAVSPVALVDPDDAQLARDLLQTTLDSLPSSIAVLDERGEIILTNRAWRVFALVNGGAAPSGVGANYLAVCDAAVDDLLVERVAKGLRAIIDGRTTEFTAEYPCHGPAIERWFSLRATRYEGPGPARVVVLHDDVTMRREAEADVAMQAALLDEVDASVIAADPDGNVTYWSGGAERLYGWTRAEALGRGIEMFGAAGADLAGVFTGIEQEGRWEGRLPLVRKDGSGFPAMVRVRSVAAEAGRPAGMIGVSVDMTEQADSERLLVAARNYMDAVADSMGEGLYTVDPDGRLTYMNLAAEKLLGWTSEDLVGRTVHDFAHSYRADGTANPIEDCQIRGAQRDGTTVTVEDDVFTCSDGRLLPVSYTAAPFVTADGVQGCAVVFEDITERKQREQTLERDAETLSWVARVQDAIEADEFVLYAQPIIDLRSGEVIQRELLLRMRDEDGGIVAPGAFLPIAEKYGLIGDIDLWVIQHAIEIAGGGLSVQLNLSARSVGDPAVLEHIERCLKAADADPGLLVFEITETALLEGEADAKAFADRLHVLGCGLALDDFGTGYGGLTYLKQLPVDFLKIDIEFVRDIATNPASRHVVEAVVALAISFDLQTVGEGVEDAETLELLRDLGVDFAQGYHIGRPGPLEA